MLVFGILWWFSGISCSVASARSPVPSFLHSHRIFIMAHTGWGTRLYWPDSRCRCYYFQYSTQKCHFYCLRIFFKRLLGLCFSTPAFSCYQKLVVLDRHRGVSVSCCPTMEMKEQEMKEQHQSAAWVQDPLPLWLCLQNLRDDLCCAYGTAIFSLVTHSWALSYLLKHKELSLKFLGQCCISLNQIYEM